MPSSPAPGESQPNEEFFLAPFVPTVVFVQEGAGLHTRLCVFNYYSEVLPKVLTGATAHIWFFRQDGSLVGKREIHLPYRGQLQFDLSELGVEFVGTAGLSLIPDTLPEKMPPRMGSGYYAQYSDDAGHLDYSHEWEAMKFKPFAAHPWLCVVRPKLFPDTRIILLNSYYGTDPAGASRPTIRLRSGLGAVLSEKELPPIPPRGSRVISLGEIEPQHARMAEQHGTIAVEAVGANLQGPFTWVVNRGGDFNIHHFC